MSGQVLGLLGWWGIGGVETVVSKGGSGEIGRFRGSVPGDQEEGSVPGDQGCRKNGWDREKRRGTFKVEDGRMWQLKSQGHPADPPHPCIPG